MCAIWIGAFAVALMRGPAMGDHEVIVAQIARQSIEDNQYLVPHYLDTPFLVKPPMAPWAVIAVTEAAKMLFGGSSDLPPVSAATARLPSIIAMLLTILILHRLGSSMFGSQAGFITAFVFATSLGTMLFAINATAEALLTLFCTWAFAEFWWSRKAETAAQRTWRLLRFYLAFGLAMMAKGPMPLMLVGPAIAIWWWCERPARLLAAVGPRAIPGALRLGFMDLWPKLRTALSRLGLWWGVPVFLAAFVPWLILVARKVPYAWELWNYEYLDRFKGEYPGCKSGRYHYYIPIVIGLTVPWMLSMPEAIVSPFLRKYRANRRPLLFAWFWLITGVVIMSLMSFKKPYYIIPVLPACAILLTPVLQDFFFRVRNVRPGLARLLFGIILAAWTIGLGVMWFVARDMYPEIWHGNVATYSPLIVLGMVGLLAWVGALYLRGRRLASMISLGCMSVFCFVAAWATIGPAVDNTEDPKMLVQKLREARIPRDAEIYWAGNRPDGRVAFYENQPIRQIVDPYKLVSTHDKAHDEMDLLIYVGTEIANLLSSDHHVYIVLQRGQVHALRRYLEPDPPMRELFSIDRGPAGDDEDDWVVVTNLELASATRLPAQVAASTVGNGRVSQPKVAAVQTTAGR
ncbi:MAG: glycosyltransferase family 39 protein [Phycisphaerae bacterium]|nr:glycosyltransferase family 39 protein [Phycisphaerae bacterium]